MNRSSTSSLFQHDPLEEPFSTKSQSTDPLEEPNEDFKHERDQYKTLRGHTLSQRRRL